MGSNVPSQGDAVHAFGGGLALGVRADVVVVLGRVLVIEEQLFPAADVSFGKNS